MAFPDSNCHGLNGVPFKEAVGICTGGDLTITVFACGSLFCGGDIERAVQTEQPPSGERLWSAHRNENPIFGIDSVPFLATSLPTSDKLRGVAKNKMSEILAKQNLILLFSVPWLPRIYVFAKKDAFEALAKNARNHLKTRPYWRRPPEAPVRSSWRTGMSPSLPPTA